MNASAQSNNIVASPHKKRSLSRKESRLRLPRGDLKKWIPPLCAIGVFSFVVLTVVNISISILRLEDHRVLHTQRMTRTEPMFPGKEGSSSTSQSLHRPLLPPSIWSTRKLAQPVDISPYLSTNQTEKAKSLCGKFIYSTLKRAVRAGELGQEVFVATGDIDFMWIRDSVVQMSSYL